LPLQARNFLDRFSDSKQQKLDNEGEKHHLRRKAIERFIAPSHRAMIMRHIRNVKQGCRW
jgi:hypothetical protein